MSLMKKCLVCKTEIVVTPSRYERTKYCSRKCKAEAQRGKRIARETEFKKGHTRSVKFPVGTITIRTRTRDSKQRQWIKVGEPNKWELYCHYVWRRRYGDIPQGLVIHHVDYNTLNDDIDNLSLVTRARHIKLHQNDLSSSRPPQTHIKDKTCPDCNLQYRGRGRSVAKCTDCATKADNESKLRYKMRQMKQGSQGCFDG